MHPWQSPQASAGGYDNSFNAGHNGSRWPTPHGNQQPASRNPFMFGDNQPSSPNNRHSLGMQSGGWQPNPSNNGASPLNSRQRNPFASPPDSGNSFNIGDSSPSNRNQSLQSQSGRWQAPPQMQGNTPLHGPGNNPFGNPYPSGAWSQHNTRPPANLWPHGGSGQNGAGWMAQNTAQQSEHNASRRSSSLQRGSPNARFDNEQNAMSSAGWSGWTPQSQAMASRAPFFQDSHKFQPNSGTFESQQRFDNHVSGMPTQQQQPTPHAAQPWSPSNSFSSSNQRVNNWSGSINSAVDATQGHAPWHGAMSPQSNSFGWDRPTSGTNWNQSFQGQPDSWQYSGGQSNSWQGVAPNFTNQHRSSFDSSTFTGSLPGNHPGFQAGWSNPGNEPANGVDVRQVDSSIDKETKHRSKKIDKNRRGDRSTRRSSSMQPRRSSSMEPALSGNWTGGSFDPPTAKAMGRRSSSAEERRGIMNDDRNYQAKPQPSRSRDVGKKGPRIVKCVSCGADIKVTTDDSIVSCSKCGKPNGVPHASAGYSQPVGCYPAPSPQPAPKPSGKKKALLVGCNYPGTRAELRGCINDVARMSKMLKTLYGFERRHMIILTDELKEPDRLPTKANILEGFKWLVTGVQPGDVLFFHFSGHGGQQEDPNYMEDDGFDETILPTDFQISGQIVDDEIFDHVCAPLPSGVKLTAIMDCCHSGTGLDLPFTLKGNNTWTEDDNPCHSAGDVVLISGCEDNQCSADASGRHGEPAGAMTTALCDCLEQNRVLAYPALLQQMHAHLRKRGHTQRPQLTSSQRFDPTCHNFDICNDILPNTNPTLGRHFRKKKHPKRSFGSLMDGMIFAPLMIGLFLPETLLLGAGLAFGALYAGSRAADLAFSAGGAMGDVATGAAGNVLGGAGKVTDMVTSGPANIGRVTDIVPNKMESAGAALGGGTGSMVKGMFGALGGMFG